MTAIALRARNISKKYKIGALSHDTLRDQIAHAVKTGLRRQPMSQSTSELWALSDVSFDIRHGEVVGVIGRNGAGKSTLLKILARITEPTRGRIELYGRVGSLLEVGTGFHPELTGRENIYLNGAILGMKRREINSKFNEILDFAEIEKFIDTPVKRYSSGMYVRLAFAVAAHLEPEILLVDEVLAVGDLAFQRKCLGKMGDIASQGRTVLFVSHNMASLQALCQRGILLLDGQIAADAPIEQAVNQYLRNLEKLADLSLAERVDRKGRGDIQAKKVEISLPGGNSAQGLATGKPIRFSFYLNKITPGLMLSFSIYDQNGQPITTFNSATQSEDDITDKYLGSAFQCEIDELLLLPGRYRINLAISCNGILEDHIEGAAFFDIEPGYLRGRPTTASVKYGHVSFPHRWIIPNA
jgi:lipopolysaccharide transport system ATP-binding protein